MEQLNKLYEQRIMLEDEGQPIPQTLQKKIAEEEVKLITSRLSALLKTAEKVFDGIESSYKIELFNTSNGIRAYAMKIGYEVR